MLHSQEIPAADGFPIRLKIQGADSTGALGRAVAPLLKGGEIILLYGPLGAGKTCFSQGLCAGLGVVDEVVSPTFTLVNTYQCPAFTVHHLDFYRVEPDHDLDDIGVPDLLDDVFSGQAVALIEWPEPILSSVGLGEPRIELLTLPGNEADERIWHLRGVPGIPTAWAKLFEEFPENRE
jgi:tRNA threonylcarbamoyladenosine biosynthesis protein TsaE